jgi:hypothetical protein
VESQLTSGNKRGDSNRHVLPAARRFTRSVHALLTLIRGVEGTRE